MRFLLVILAFDFIIIIHELGHFIVAKLSGIKVEEFSLFVGPKLFSIKRGETAYTLRLFPILAYVKMEGEEEESDSERAFSNKPVWVRFAVVAAGPLANLISAFLIISIVYYTTGYTTRTVGLVQEGSAAYNAGIEEGDVIVGYDDKRIYDPLEVIQFLYISKGEKTTIEFVRNGTKMKKDIEPYVERTYQLGYYSESVENSNVIAELVSGGALEKVGAKPGDKIVKLNDAEIGNIDEIKSFLKENKNQPVKVTVLRDGSELVFDVEPQFTENYALGLAFSRAKGGNILDVFKNSALFTYSNIRMVPYSLYWLVTGQVSLNQMTGPVGIVSTMNDVAQQSETFKDAVLNILLWTALISAAIGATNLVPFPALDGSKLLILAIEAVSRRKIPVEKEAIITTIGFVILIGLSIFVMANDIMRFIIK
ncbi:MAG TPA: RIP metalloprotease RseP [Acetivibrio sp.]|uniref:RIP metalloprotease RseP n=1 Tax=Acetivibrio sp. TaxID=1872092 RepID=UPI002B6460CF|nr:RIP metalloprotease RseP [Acetivibrio sp.]HOM01226.1 RIP metalloprotease RseP [Acetivibrio sp.]